jgi:hypothetical protein
VEQTAADADVRLCEGASNVAARAAVSKCNVVLDVIMKAGCPFLNRYLLVDDGRQLLVRDRDCGQRILCHV